ncbi:MAG: hypothetical protein OEZ22_10545 [Spirochaetia bacterium]|nr:hypothetical protein [Spirochaetia bacterium]
MQIKKNDISQFVNSVQKQNIDKNQGQNLINEKNTQNSISADNNINIDKLRGQVKSLQADVSKIQTDISQKQIQIAYLGIIENKEDWRQSLNNFMKENFPSSIKLKIEDKTSEEYINRAQSEIGIMKNDLLKKEVQLQNIFSMGMISETGNEKADINLIKDMKQAEKLFSNLRKETVSNLLKL